MIGEYKVMLAQIVMLFYKTTQSFLQKILFLLKIGQRSCIPCHRRLPLTSGDDYSKLRYIPFRQFP